jgi:hypothetical protein
MLNAGLCMFLKHFEQFEHAGERLPGAGAGALGAYLSLETPLRSPVDIEEKANRLLRRW